MLIQLYPSVLSYLKDTRILRVTRLKTPSISRVVNVLLRDNYLMFQYSRSESATQSCKNPSRTVAFRSSRCGYISLPRPLPGWLIEEKNCGSLKIYQIN
jgi:hypothetical protein